MTRLSSVRAAAASLAALAVALAAGPVPAASFNGTPTIESGQVSIDRSVTGQDTINITSDRAVIRWNLPSQGGTVEFQPAATTAIFQNVPTGSATFTVLNRILPGTTGPVSINGTVISRLQTAAGTTPGGTVWFYSPGGIVVGSTAVFDIGRLLLSTADPSGGTGSIANVNVIGGTSTPGALVDIRPGARITSSMEGGYVAVVAPAINQRGLVEVNGAAAYVAAENATITVNGSLISINVTTGSDANNGFPLTHTGTTRWLTNAGPRRIFAVVVPKAQLVNMLFSTTTDLGFADATTATTSDGKIVLSAGRRVTDTALSAQPINGIAASIDLGAGRYDGDVIARATTDILAASTTSTPFFANNVSFRAGSRAFLGARQQGVTLTVGGTADISTLTGLVNNAPGSTVTAVQGGQTRIFAENGATLMVAGAVRANAGAVGADAGQTTIDTGATGGTSYVFANGGTLRIGGDVTSDASVSAAGGRGGAFNGGEATLSSQGTGTVTVGGLVTVLASADNSASVNPGTAPAGTAGMARIFADTNSTLTITGAATATANGLGAPVTTTNGVGGAGNGGDATLVASNNSRITVGGIVTLAARGDGGGGAALAGATGGVGTGKQARLYAFANSTLTVNGASLFLDSGGTGGAATGTGSTGGAGFGGTTDFNAGPFDRGSYVVAQTGSTVAIPNSMILTSVGFGGIGATGGGGTGGFSNLVSFDGTILATGQGTANFIAAGRGGAGALGGAGGNGLGGQIIVSAATTASAATAAGRVTLGNVLLNAGALGGAGGASTQTGAGGKGGDATSGNVTMIAQAGNGTLVAGQTTIAVDAASGAGGSSVAGTGGAGGTATGGFAINVGTISNPASDFTTGSARFGNLTIAATATAGKGGDSTSGTGGNGGVAIAGGAGLLSRGSPVTAGNVTLTANATGGAGGAGATRGDGGRAEAGATSVTASVRFQATARGSITTGGLVGQATATGGAGAVAGTTVYGQNDVSITDSDATFAGLSLTTTGATSPGAFSSDILVTNGTVNVQGLVDVVTPGNIGLLVGTGGSLTAGNISLRPAGAIVLGEGQTQPTTPGSITAASFTALAPGGIILGEDLNTTNTLQLTSAGAITTRSIRVTAGDLLVASAGVVTTLDLTATGNVEVDSDNAGATIRNATAGGDFDADTAGAFTATNLTAGGSVTVVADGTATVGALSAGLVNPTSDTSNRKGIYVQGANATIASAAAAGDVGFVAAVIGATGAVGTPGNLVSGAVTSGRSIVLTGGTITTSGAITGASSAGEVVYFGSPTIVPTLGTSIATLDPRLLLGTVPTQFATGAIGLGGAVTGGQITLASAVGTTAGALTAASRLLVTTAGTATFNGAAVGASAEVFSGDIAIGSAGSLGTPGTGTLTLHARGTGPVLLGGAGGTGYVLDQSEVDKLRANRIVIAAEGQSRDMTVRSLRIAGSAAQSAALTGTSPALTLSATGNMRVEGALRYEGAGTGDSLILSAPAGRIDIATEAGGAVGMFSPTGTPAGTLRLAANLVQAADNALFTRLVADFNFAGRDAALAVPTATARPEGVLQAGTMQITARDAVLIQNTNTTATPGGFTVGTGGLAVSRATAEGTTKPLDVTIFGRGTQGDGGFLTGQATRAAVMASASELTTTSSVNGCVLSAATCALTPTAEPAMDVQGDISAAIQAAVDGPLSATADTLTALPAIRISTVVDTSSFSSTPLIEEPVTGGGNSSLWSGADTGMAVTVPAGSRPPVKAKEKRR